MVDSDDIFYWVINHLPQNKLEFEQSYIDSKYTLSPLESTWNFLINYCVNKKDALDMKKAVHDYRIAEGSSLKDEVIKKGLIREILDLKKKINHSRNRTNTNKMQILNLVTSCRSSATSINIKKDKYFSQVEKKFRLKSRDEQLANYHFKMVGINNELAHYVRYQQQCCKPITSKDANHTRYERFQQFNVTKQYDVESCNYEIRNDLSSFQSEINRLLSLHSLNLKNFVDKNDSANKISKKSLFSKLLSKFVANREAAMLRNEAHKYAMESITCLFSGMEMESYDKEKLHDYLEHFRLSKMKQFFQHHPDLSQLSQQKKKHSELSNDFEHKKSSIVALFSDIVDDMRKLIRADCTNVKFKIENISMVIRNLVEMCQVCTLGTEKFEESINKINILIQKSLNETLNRSQWNATLNSDGICQNNQTLISQFMIRLIDTLYHKPTKNNALKQLIKDSFSLVNPSTFITQINDLVIDCTRNYVLSQNTNSHNPYNGLITERLASNDKYSQKLLLTPYMPQFTREINSIENLISSTYSQINQKLSMHRSHIDALSSCNDEIKDAMADWWDTPGFYCFQDL